MKKHADLALEDLCFTRNRYRKHYRYRAAVAVSSTGEWNIEEMEFGFKPRNRAARVNIVVGGHEIRGEDEAQARKVIRPDDSNEDTVSTLNYWVTLLETLVRLVPSIQEIRGIAAGEELVSSLHLDGEEHHSAHASQSIPVNNRVTLDSLQDTPGKMANADIVIMIAADQTGSSLNTVARRASSACLPSRHLPWRISLLYCWDSFMYVVLRWIGNSYIRMALARLYICQHTHSSRMYIG